MNGSEISAQGPERVRAVRVVDQVSLTELSSAIEKISEFQRLVQERLRSGLDYGVIPGTARKTLLKPGAEKICMLLGLSPFSAVEKAESSDNSQNLLRRYWQHSCRT